MKKALLLFLAGAFVLAGCDKNNEENGGGNENGGGEQLGTPVLAVSEQTENSFTVSWEPIENAVSYVYTFNDGEEQPTSQCTVSFSDLMPGDYTVNVKARPLDGSGYSESEWATIAVTIELGDDWFSISDPYLFDSSVSGTNRYSMIAVDLAGHDLESLDLGVIKAEDAEGLTNEQLKALMNLTLSDISALNDAGSIKGVAVEGLEPETEYVVAACATHVSGAEKVVVTASVTTEAAPPMSEDLKAWIGTYTVEASGQLQMAEGADGYVELNKVDDPKTFTITISEYDYQSLMITGLSQYSADMPALAVLADEQGSLAILADVMVSDGVYWMPVCETSDGFTFVSGCEYMFLLKNNNGTIESEAYTGTLQGGVEFTVYAADIFGLSGNSVSIYHELPCNLPAGTFTLTKTSEQVPQQIFVPSKGQVLATASVSAIAPIVASK